MGQITASNVQGIGDKPVTETTLTTSDTLVYKPDKTQLLIIRNPTGGALSPEIRGSDAPTSYPVSGIGEVDTSSFHDFASIPASEVRMLRLGTISKILAGATVTLTGAENGIAQLLEY